MEASYAKALNKIEEFMQKSGIREICSNLCIGKCCGKCYESEKACHKNEGRRLACSFYICHPLKELLFTRCDRMIFRTVELAVGNKVRDVMSKCIPGYLNIYFKVNDQSIRGRFSIDLNILNRLDEIDVNKVLSKSLALRGLHRDFCVSKEVSKQ